VQSITNIRLELEDRQWLEDLPEVPVTFFGRFSRPNEITLDDIKQENQGQIGSCQGNSITSCTERTLNVARTNAGMQLSRMYAYLASQKLDGLLGGDRGSTISSGVKIALQGIPSEQDVPYPNPARYPSRGGINSILQEGRKLYSVKSTWKVPTGVELIYDFLASGGAINLGISWWGGIVPRDRIVRNYNPPRGAGGHAIALLGYRKDDLFTIMNSHGDGEFYVTPEALVRMLNHQNTAAVGVLGSTNPEPVDWFNDSPMY